MISLSFYKLLPALGLSLILPILGFSQIDYIGFSRDNFLGDHVYKVNGSTTAISFNEPLGVIPGQFPNKSTLIPVNTEVLLGTYASQSEQNYIFSYNVSTKKFEVQYIFSDSEGINLLNGLVRHPNGKFYGIGETGGQHG